MAHHETVAQPTQLTLDKTLARIRKQFAQGAWRSWSRVFALHDKIRDCIRRGGDSGRFDLAHELLQGGLSQWLNDLAHEAETCFRTLLDVAGARPDWVPDDPVQWARAKIDRFLTEEFKQGAEREDKQWVGPAPLVEPAELNFKPARHLDWFRRACDGPPNVNLLPGSTGWREPWCAPQWVLHSKRPTAGWMLLPVEVTNSLIWLAQSDFKRQLSSMLDQAEETAYIRLARRPSKQRQEAKSRKPARGRTQSRKSGPKAKPRNRVLREILSKQPELSCKDVCRLMDSKFASDDSRFPTLSQPEFGGRTYHSWEQAYADESARNLVQALISRCRPKSS